MYYCNPINIEYLYQFQKDPQSGEMQIYREAADPSLLSFNGKYYIFASRAGIGVLIPEPRFRF